MLQTRGRYRELVGWVCLSVVRAEWMVSFPKRPPVLFRRKDVAYTGGTPHVLFHCGASAKTRQENGRACAYFA